MARSKVWREVGLAVLVAVVIGVSVGLGLGLLARELGWSTSFVGPLTGGIVSALTVAVFQSRSRSTAHASVEAASKQDG